MFCPTAAESEESVVPESSYIRLRHFGTETWVRASDKKDKKFIDGKEKQPVMAKVCNFHFFFTYSIQIPRTALN